MLTAFVFALCSGLVLTPLVRALARRAGMVAKPRADRWHTQPTALLGGVGIFAAFLLTILTQWNLSREGVLIVACASSMFVLGFVDDLVQLRPRSKLAAQLLAAAVPAFAGLALTWTPWPLVNGVLTVFWLVGITNALNLLDNMDGLSSGIAFLASCFMAWFFWDQGKPELAATAMGLAGACGGFLVFNWNPASIFMGDSGSLFLGYLLSGLGLLLQSHRSRGLFSVLFPPVLVLLIPILDTSLVTIARRLNGRAISQGGRDHTSHRLVALGLSERGAVLVLYAIALVSGSLGVYAYRSPSQQTGLLLAPFVLLVLAFCVYLGKVRVYAPKETPKEALPT